MVGLHDERTRALQLQDGRKPRRGTYLPPDQPVLTSHPVAPYFCIFSASMAAYLVGWSMMKAAPKQAEKVACGSLMPSSVPATRAV
jgi:hypothetical protein